MSELMGPEDWRVVYPMFSIHEAWGDAYGLQRALVMEGLYPLRRYVGRPVVVHCAMEPRERFSWHTTGHAADIHIQGLSLVDQWLAAERFDALNGIGLYPWWNQPGLHVDVRPKESRPRTDARWISPAPGKYVALDQRNMAKYCMEA